MAKEKFVDTIKKVFSSREEEAEQTEELPQMEVLIEGKKVIVPPHIYINLQTNKNK